MSLRARALLFLLPPLLTALGLYAPYPRLEAARRSTEGVQITDRNGRLLVYLPGSGGSFMARLTQEELTPAVRDIFVRLEDRRFYHHRGADPLAVARAALENLRRGRVVSGASTITMQAARLLHPHSGGLFGKGLELAIAYRLESKLTKHEILLFYLNRLPFGLNTRGVGGAALAYFDRPLGELSRAQVLLLATLPRAPAAFDPFRRPEALRAKALSLAPRLGISAAEVEEALDGLRRGKPVLRAPHFVSFVSNELPRLAAFVPHGQEIARIVTTLDLALYEDVTARLERELERTPALRNAAALVLDNGSSEVLAWIGAPDFFDREASGAIDGVRARSPSGSTLKPFLYALALERGYSCATLLPDLKLGFGAEEVYRPENFDRRSRGLVRLRSALAGSLNVPAVYLLSRLGLKSFLAACASLGFEMEPGAGERYGLGIAVGSAPVSLLELVRAFSVFPRGGTIMSLRSVRELATVDGVRIPIPPSGARRVFSPESAWLIRSILSDASARATGFGTRSRLNTPFPAMFKSGTSSGYHSLWCLGASPEHTVGVWAGNLDRRAAFGATGSSVPAVVVTGTLEQLARRGGAPRVSGASPIELASLRVCTLTGFRSSPACPSSRIEYFRAGTAPARLCPVHAGDLDLESLAVELFLDQGGAPSILFPHNGSRFYRDPDAAEKQQGISTWIVAPREEVLTVSLNGSVQALRYPFRLELPVQPGSYRLEVSGRFGREALSYTVQ